MANLQKKDIVATITDQIKDQNNYVLVQFEQTTHKGLEALRHDLKKKGAHLQIVKNSLFEKAVHKLSQKHAAFRTIQQQFPLTRRSALLSLTGDWGEGLKAYYEAVKDNESFTFKFGTLDDQQYTQVELVRLATLPGKDQLMAKLIGAMKNPMVRTVRSMTSPMQKLVFVLKIKSKSIN